MNGIKTTSVFFLAGFALALAISGPGIQIAAAQQAPYKMAEAAFKNIQVLKGVPAEEVGPTMNFFEASLGVTCDFCHDERLRDLDVKETKQITRKMLRMEMSINNANYGGSHEVTCFTCHRGKTEPVGVPLVTGEESQPTFAATMEKEADELLDKYVAALGGVEAIRKLSSRVMKGSVTDVLGRKFPVEIYAKAPTKRLLVVTPLAKGVSTAGARSHQEADYLENGYFKGVAIGGYNGDVGWIAFRDNRPADMRMNELDAARLEDPLFFAGQMRQVFSELRVVRTEKVDDREAYVVFGRMGSLPQVRLYFDKESGMLVRLVFYTETAAGRFPTQIDFADFRNEDGVKIPFRWIIAQTRGLRFTYQIDQAQLNIPIEESKFVKPGGPQR